MAPWILYGANGYTGELIAREARARGLHPVLAGRNRAAVERLGGELGLESRCFSLDDPSATRTGLGDAMLVLHCAGPFSTTAEPMLQACLAQQAHYLDITGEIAVFERAQSLDGEAQRAGIVVCPGVGFDVVPTDCLAATLSRVMPDAAQLALGYDSRSALSRGTAKTMIEGLRTGSQVRVATRIESIPLGACVREIDFGAGPKQAVAIAWGDVSTAYWTTRIPNIEVYAAASPRSIESMRSMNRWRPLLRTRLAQWWLKRRVERGKPGPDDAERERAPVLLWGEVRNASGNTRIGRMRTANGYTVTVHAALGIVAQLLQSSAPHGYHTPSQLMGADYASKLPGSTPITVTDSQG